MRILRSCYIVILTIIILFSVTQLNAQPREVTYPGAKHKILLDYNKRAEYKKLAEQIGFNVGEDYTYTDYVDIKKENKVGIAGHYECILLSTGGNGLDFKAAQRFNKQQFGWEMMYYSNHDLTVIWEISHNKSRTRSFVRILKIAKGRRPNLHLE